MIVKTNLLKFTALTFSVLTFLGSSEIFASSSEESLIKPAQALYQDEAAFTPVIDEPIWFSVKNFKENVHVNSNRTVFEVKVPGLYSIDSFLLVNVPNIGDSVGGYITINENKFLTFFNRETSTLSTLIEFHFNDRIVYLKKGDTVSVILSEFTPGTVVLSRGFSMVALNNSH